ncbi:MAG TPA: class II aldolase/adducin family protein [Burkholderiales bacterium]|nr:class II aldolase/adducin family protein [Burkholderiales bacterium]
MTLAALIDDLVTANHILYKEGVVDGFGHVSVRHPEAPERYFLARSLAPAVVRREDILEFDLDSNAIDARGARPYLERFIHGEIYRARPEVHAIVHSHSPSVIPFGVTHTTLKPIFHLGGFLGGGTPIFEIRETAGDNTDMLIRTPQLGVALARTLGSASYALMRGHGSVAVGGSLKQVVYRAIYGEVNARLQSEALRLGTITYLNDAEAANAAATNDQMVDRPWELWKKRVADW